MVKTGLNVVREALKLLGLEIDATAEAFRIEPKDGLSPAVTGTMLADRNELLLVAHVGYVVAGREATYRVLLEHHYLGLKTKGATFALDPLDGDVVVQRFYPLAEASSETVAGLIASFASDAAAVRDVIGA